MRARSRRADLKNGTDAADGDVMSSTAADHARGPGDLTPAVDPVALERARVLALLPAIRRSFLTSVLSITVFSALLVRFNPIGIGSWIAIRAVFSVVALRLVGVNDPAGFEPAPLVRRLTWIMGCSGALWGAIPVFARPEAPEWRAVVILWLFGNQAVITTVCTPHRRVFRAAIGTVTILGAAGIAVTGGRFGLVLASLLLLGGGYSVSMFQGMSRAVTAGLMGQLVTASLATALERRHAELQHANLQLEHLSSVDELTNVANRRRFRAATAGEDDRARSSGWVALLDIDHFRAVNEVHGHAGGDRVLAVLATRWLAVLPEAAVLGRLGGDEFACFLPAIDHAEAHALCDRLRGEASIPVPWEAAPIRTSCSVGLAPIERGESLSGALAAADAALYRSKDDGRDAVSTATGRRDPGVSGPAATSW